MSLIVTKQFPKQTVYEIGLNTVNQNQGDLVPLQFVAG